METAVLFVLIVINGVFAMSEIALLTARKSRLTTLADDGDRGARLALELRERPTRFLSTVQIGITSIGILNGIVGEAALARPIAERLITFGMPGPWAQPLATALVVVVITYFTIVIGELVPKRLGQISPEAIARAVARPMTLLARMSMPFVFVLARSTNLVVRLLGVRDVGAPTVTEEEIHAMLAEGSDAGIIERDEHAMVRNVFRLDERRIGSLMVPRSEIVYLDRSAPLEQNLAMVARSVYSRFPVCDGGLDRVLGFVHTKQLLAQSLGGRRPSLDVELEPPLYVPETLTGLELLDNFRSSGVHVALVVDEYGELQGMVTLYDLMEAITGEVRSREGQESLAVQREDGSWLLDGLIPVPELKDVLGLASAPEEERAQYNSLAGMLMVLLGRVPSTGDAAIWQGWRFEVIDLDDRRVDKVLATAVPPAAEPDLAPPSPKP